MNFIIKTLVSMWLISTLIVAWLGCAFVGFFLCFTKWSFMYQITPFMGLTIAFCIIRFGMYMLKSNPTGWLDSKLNQYIAKLKAR